MLMVTWCLVVLLDPLKNISKLGAYLHKMHSWLPKIFLQGLVHKIVQCMFKPVMAMHYCGGSYWYGGTVCTFHYGNNV